MRSNRHIKNHNREVINEIAMTRFLLIGLGVIANASTLIVLVGLAVIHAVTIITAYSISGFESALLVAVLPGFAEIYWFIKMWSSAGLINQLSVWIFGYIALLLIAGVAWFLSYQCPRTGQRNDKGPHTYENPGVGLSMKGLLFLTANIFFAINSV